MLVIDRNTASRMGITPQDIDDTLYDAFGQRQVSTMFTQLNQYRVVLEVMPEFQQGPQSLQYPRCPVPQRRPGAVERVHPGHGNHHSACREPSGTVPRRHALVQSCAGRIARRRGARRSSGRRRRSSFRPASGAVFRARPKPSRPRWRTSRWLILAALVTVYIVLGILYESYIHPLTILSTLPSAGVGALLALMLFRTEFSVIALIGIVLLIGIVKKNAIMMIDFALEAERKEGKRPEEAIYEACLLRFRPIMMTTMAALLGALPLAMSTGVGSELRRPLGIAIVGGLIVSQILTLYTTPVVYLAFDRLARRIGERRSPNSES